MAKINGSRYRQASEAPHVGPAPMPGGRWRITFGVHADGVAIEVALTLTANGAHHAWQLAAPILGGRAFSDVKVTELGGRA